MESSVDLVDLLTIRTIVHLGAEEIGSLGKLLVEGGEEEEGRWEGRRREEGWEVVEEGRRERGEGWEEREVKRKERETSTT